MALARVAGVRQRGRADVRTASGEFPQWSVEASGRRDWDLCSGPRRPGPPLDRASHHGQESSRSSPLSRQLRRLRRSVVRILGGRSCPWCQPSTSVNLQNSSKRSFPPQLFNPRRVGPRSGPKKTPGHIGPSIMPPGPSPRFLSGRFAWRGALPPLSALGNSFPARDRGRGRGRYQTAIS